MSNQERIELADGVEIIYGVGNNGNYTDALLPSYSTHRINVLSGALDISYLDAKAKPTDTPISIAAGKTSATQDFYNLSGVGTFTLKATGATAFTITGK